MSHIERYDEIGQDFCRCTFNRVGVGRVRRLFRRRQRDRVNALKSSLPFLNGGSDSGEGPKGSAPFCCPV